MGEMFAYYYACDVAFIGGSLLPFGGQNLIEACSVGKPVLIGQHTYNFAQASDIAVACDAAIRVDSAAELIQILNQLLEDSGRRTHMAQAGLKFVHDNQGATECAVSLIAEALKHRF